MTLIVLLAFILHPIHISVCEINYSVESKTLQFSQRIFADDLEEALNNSNNTRIDILKLGKNERDELLKPYTMEKIEVKADNSILKLNYLGSEIEEGVCWIYYESSPLEKKFKNLDIKNIVLFELFADQTTIIQVRNKEEKVINLRLVGDKIRDIIPFN